jgi:glycosyltransferase involved in cell wall biosynthesis
MLIVEASSLLAGSQKVTLKILECIKKKNITIFSNLKSDFDLFGGFYKDLNPQRFFFHKSIDKYLGTGSFSFKELRKIDYLLLIGIIIYSNMEVVLRAKKENINTIYCYDPKGILLCGIFSRIFKINIVWHLHGKLNFPNIINKFLLNCASEVVVPSYSVKKYLDKYNKEVKVVYNGFDFDDEVQIDPIYVNDNDINLIYVGTIVPNKGLHTIIECLLKSSMTENIKLNVLGEPIGTVGKEYIKYIKSRIELLPKNIVVEFLGWRNNPKDYIKSSDALIFASVDRCDLDFTGDLVTYRASEALPTVLIESISLGVPVIANNTNGVEEIVYSNQFGYIVDDLSSCDLDKILAQVLSIGKFATPSNFKNKFSLLTMQSEMTKIIEGCIKR